MRKLLLILLLPLYIYGQALLPPWLNGQFTDANGHPLSNGRVYFCVAQSSCPGTPQAAYTSSSASAQLANPSVLDASGRVPSGIWLTAGLTYKIVVTTSLGAVVSGAGGDNILGASGSAGGAGSNFWTLSGSAISNNNGGGGGDVNAGGNLKAGAYLTTGLGLKIGNGNVSPNYAVLKASPAMSADASWTWPRVDNVGVLTSDGSGNLVFAPGGGGGGGTPGGPPTSVQFNNTVFGGSANFVWDNTNQILKVTSTSSNIGVNVVAGYVGSDLGFIANPSTATVWNAIRATNGGMDAVSFTAQHYVNTGHSLGAPTPTSGDTFGAGNGGAMYCDTTSTPCVEQLWNGSAWVALATGGATSPGGSDTAVQFNDHGSFAGTANYIWNNASNQLKITGTGSTSTALDVANGAVLSDYGFVVSVATGTNFDTISDKGGGMAALSFTASNYINTGTSAGPPGSGGGSAPITPGDSLKPGMMTCDSSVSPCVEKYYNGSAWVPMSGGGGGGGTPGLPDTSVQFASAGAFVGSANMLYNNAGQVLTLKGVGTATLSVQNGFVGSDNGFRVTPFGVNTRYDAIQAFNAGMVAQSFTATSYIQSGHSFGSPTLTTADAFHPGAMYWDDGAGAEKVFNGVSWVNLSGGGGGVASLNGLTGALNLVGATNQITVSPFGTSLNLTLPQGIATNSSVQFNNVVAGASGGSFTFANFNNNFTVNGNGSISAAGASTFNAQLNTHDIIPSSGNVYNLGGPSNYWVNGYFTNVNATNGTMLLTNVALTLRSGSLLSLTSGTLVLAPNGGTGFNGTCSGGPITVSAGIITSC